MCKNENFKHGTVELLHDIRWARTHTHTDTHSLTHTQIEVVTTFAAYLSLQNMMCLRKMSISSAKVVDAVYKHVLR